MGRIKRGVSIGFSTDDQLTSTSTSVENNVGSRAKRIEIARCRRRRRRRRRTRRRGPFRTTLQSIHFLPSMILLRITISVICIFTPEKIVSAFSYFQGSVSSNTYYLHWHRYKYENRHEHRHEHRYEHQYEHQYPYQRSFSRSSNLNESKSPSSSSFEYPFQEEDGDNHHHNSQVHGNINRNSNNYHSSDNAIGINYLDNCRPDSEQRPKRLIHKKRTNNKYRGKQDSGKSSPFSKLSNDHSHQHQHDDQLQRNLTTAKEQKLHKWGVQKHDQKDTLSCPSTVHTVAKECFHAVSSTLYCRNFLDPNIASNAMAVSVTDKRPVGFAYWPKGRDVGRLGVEIDNARFLIMDPKHSSCGVMHPNSSSHKAQFAEVEGRALRRVVLLLASKLSQMPWYGLEDEDDGDDDDDDDDSEERQGQYKKTRPIAIFFNTISQALMASRELQLLRQIALHQNQEISSYDNIRILCLGKDTLPDDMSRRGRGETANKKKIEKNKGRRKWGSSRELSNGKVDPKLGMVIVVQPSDYNYELNPPAPSVGTVKDLQRLLSRASVNQIPSVIVSPRLMEQYEGRPGIEQSGYQQSSIYGGIEPPRGPTPWLLRDFIPPVYSWIGCALELSSRRPSPFTLEAMANEQQQQQQQHANHTLDYEYRYYSRVAMYQTVMESGHPWHLFAVKNNIQVSSSSRDEKFNTSYEYIASTNPHSGRPSRDLLRDVISEFI